MTIFWDLDGVLYDNNLGVCKLFNIDNDNEIFRNRCKADYDYIVNLIGENKFNQGVLNAGGPFWENLELLPWARKLYDGCIKLAGEENCFFLTSHGKFIDAPSAKVKAVLRDFGSHRCILTRYKHLLAAPGRVLIDDKPQNVSDFEAHGGTGILWPSQYFFLDGLFDVDIYLEKLFNRLNGSRQA